MRIKMMCLPNRTRKIIKHDCNSVIVNLRVYCHINYEMIVSIMFFFKLVYLYFHRIVLTIVTIYPCTYYRNTVTCVYLYIIYIHVYLC